LNVELQILFKSAAEKVAHEHAQDNGRLTMIFIMHDTQ